MKTVCRTLDIVKKTTTMIQKVFVYYEVTLDRKLWDKTVYGDDDASLRDDPYIFFIMSNTIQFFYKNIR